MRVGLAVLVIHMTGLLHTCTSINPACDCVVYQSHGLSSGRFTSPNFPQYYPSNINCVLYTFIGDATEIIELTFIQFDLKMPDPSGRCFDFLRVYQNLERPEVNEHNQHDMEFCGGYNSIQSTIYSSGRSMVLEFHTEPRSGRPGNYTGFKGIYRFLNKANYITTGIRAQGKQCTYDFHSNSSHISGRFFSPFYPQHYKASTSCRYHFHARQGERVRIMFTNIQLHHIDASPSYYSCRDSPDVITVYDGTDSQAPVIGQFCSVRNSEEVVSTGSELVVAFTSDDRNQKQGFAATYEFMSRVIKPKGPKSIPDAGVPTTSPEFQCNENINSRHHRNGTISSPNYPSAYPAPITCRYIFTGVGRERIQLRFLHMDLHFPSGNPAEPID
ncbi:bone morphogenetic protein 1 [Aplysia californica]|uniref:Bone morphogenetic protein 1 n=1 Tax=Aplysia californica TaxID=6500 RepID=A0ABM0JPF6_APLCA|nr:bone morphogenetic protein 1 [Aplysia californica]